MQKRNNPDFTYEILGYKVIGDLNEILSLL